jgi:4-amino-4-deoxy-L-arabinose transferase-like glycosyltransferase
VSQAQRTDKRDESAVAAQGAAESGARRGRVRLLCAAAMIHLLLSATVYGLGHYAWFPDAFDADGVAVAFASDGVRYRADAEALSASLWRGEIRYWFGADRPFHVKLYSICFALFGKWLGYNVVGAEPLNALCYLASLTLVFSLGREIFDRRAGLTAACVVALWPSFLLHTTQFLKDPLFVAGMLALILVIVRWLTRTYSWAGALATGALGALIVTVLWLARADMGELLIATVLLGALMLVARTRARENRRATNLLGMALLIAVTLSVPLVIPDALELGRSPSSVAASARREALRRATAGEGAAAAATTAPEPPRTTPWSKATAHVGTVRRRFIEMYPDSGSNIDGDVQLNDTGDLLRHLPRAVAVGFFAPFPGMWLAPGKQVGSAGRLLGGLESLLMYAVEVLALLGVWRARRRFPAWLLLAVSSTGMIALGLVVVNIGTLYRLRYVFLILLIILAAGGAARLFDELSKHLREIKESDVAG